MAAQMKAAAGQQSFAVEDHLIVVGRVEAQSQMGLQRRVCLADAVKFSRSRRRCFRARGIRHARISYFSKSRYSSRPCNGAASHSSKPEYMPP